MSQYGTPPEWDAGWEAGFDEATARYKPLVKACKALLKRWGTNKNLSAAVQAVAVELEKLP